MTTTDGPRFVWLDGRLLDAEAPHLSVFDRGFQLGDGVFETLRARGGSPTELAEHLAQELRRDVCDEIERSILNAWVPRGHLTGVSDVCFAQLDESPAGRQESQRCIDEFFFQAIEYDVHTCPARRRRKLLLEFDCA